MHRSIPFTVKLLVMAAAIAGCGQPEHEVAVAPEASDSARTGWFGENMPPHLSRGGAKGVYLWQRHGLTLEMVYVEPHDFVMGANGADWTEAPQHRETLRKGLYLARHELSWSAYEHFCGATKRPSPISRYGEPDDYPAVMSYESALAFCEWSGLAIPTERQWEAAARGTDSRIFPWGDESVEVGGRYRAAVYGYGARASVAAFPEGASPYGCLNMCGNVGEWCATVYHLRPADDGVPNSESRMIYKGGCSGFSASECRTFDREAGPPSDQIMDHIGLRPALSVDNTAR